MTLYYKTYSLAQGAQRISEETRKLWELIANKQNWRIVQLPNGYYQAEYKNQPCECETKDCGNCPWVDVTRRETFENITTWYEELMKNSNTYPVVVLVGNKIDKRYFDYKIS